MADLRLGPAKKLVGCPVIPGDKSISHRALIFGALATGTTEITNLLASEDVQSTARVLRQLGVVITTQNGITRVEGRGLAGFTSPQETLDCGNSGTTLRLRMGVLSGAPHLQAQLTGDASLVLRPMRRVAEPLRLYKSAVRICEPLITI